MKIPGGWKAFFKNTLVAFGVIYGLNFFLGKTPTIIGSLALAMFVCLLVGFIESRRRPVATVVMGADNSSDGPTADRLPGRQPQE